MVLVDNAVYHKTKFVKNLIKRLQIPIIYSAPFSPQLSFIELLFNQLKKGDLDEIPFD